VSTSSSFFLTVDTPGLVFAPGFDTFLPAPGAAPAVAGLPSLGSLAAGVVLAGPADTDFLAADALGGGKSALALSSRGITVFLETADSLSVALRMPSKPRCLINPGTASCDAFLTSEALSSMPAYRIGKQPTSSSLAGDFASGNVVANHPKISAFMNGFALARAVENISWTTMSLRLVSLRIVFNVDKAEARTFALESAKPPRTAGRSAPMFCLV